MVPPAYPDGGWNDAKLTRTVDYGSGSYQAHGSTTGSGFGAMYELAYDIALNERKSVFLQPLFNASIVTTRMDGYSESGSAGNAGLRVEDQELSHGRSRRGQPDSPASWAPTSSGVKRWVKSG